MFFCRYVVDAHEIETEGDETTEKATSVTEQDVSIMKNRQECPLQQSKYEILELAFCETPRRTEGTETHANLFRCCKREHRHMECRRRRYDL